MNSLVSIVIPTYGGPTFLDRCVRSALSQTYNNIEIIVVDDNGIDTPAQLETAKVMADLLSDSRVKYICHESNINGSAARNTGAKHSQGDFIVLLDDDDVLFPNAVQMHMNAFEKLDDTYAMTYFGTEYFIGDKKSHESIPYKSGRILYDLLSSKIVIGSSTLCVRKTKWLEINGFDESFRRHQDLEFTARVAYKYNVFAIPYIGRRKYLEFRNNAKSAELFEKYRLHYLNKMKPLIESLTISEQKEVLGLHKFAIVKEYYKCYGLRKAISKYKELGLGWNGAIYLTQWIYIIIKRGKIRIKK